MQETNVERLLSKASEMKQVEDLFVQGNELLTANRYEDAMASRMGERLIAVYDRVVMISPKKTEACGIGRGRKKYFPNFIHALLGKYPSIRAAGYLITELTLSGMNPRSFQLCFL